MIATERKVIQLLKDIGVPPHLSGYEFIKTAILMVLEDGSVLNHITKGLYPAIAIKYKTTVSRVERAIRHSSEVTFDNMPFEMVETLFGNTISANKGKPTNSHFIATLAEAIKLKEN